MSVIDAIAGHGSQILLYGSVIVPLVLIACLMIVGQGESTPR